MAYSEGLSPSDVALLSGNTGRNSGGDGFGDGNGAWLIILFLIFAAFGWGGNRGNGGFGGGSGSGAADNYVLASDFASIQRQLYDGFNSTDRKLDATQEGICDATFSLNNSINNGFFGVQNALCQGFSGINQNIVTNGYETRLGTQSLAAQLANCCCDIRQEIADCCCKTQRAIDAVNYNMATNTNAITNAMCLNTRDIIDNQNCNYRAIHEELVANKLEMKNDRIAEQQNEINALRLAASQERQNAYLLNELKPCPSAAYIVPNPNCCYNYTVTQNPCCNNGCGGY
jgi:hypothetical protein